MARIGVVLGGGGAVGTGFHRGVLAALHDVLEFDVRRADVIVGTSSGATVAGLIRAGLGGRDLAARAAGEHPSAEAQHVELRRATPAGSPPAQRQPGRLRAPLPASSRGAWTAIRRHGARHPGAVLGGLLPSGIVPTVSAGGPLDRLFPQGWPDQQLWISAVGVDDGDRVMFGRTGDPVTDVPTAVAASCALPGWFAPVTVDERRYVDGALWSATNADVLAGEALDLVLVSAPLSGWASLLHGWQRRQLHAEVRTLRARGLEVLVIEPTRADAAVLGVDIMDRRRRPIVTRHMRAATTQRLLRGDLAEHAALLGG